MKEKKTKRSAGMLERYQNEWLAGGSAVPHLERGVFADLERLDDVSAGARTQKSDDGSSVRFHVVSLTLRENGW